MPVQFVDLMRVIRAEPIGYGNTLGARLHDRSEWRTIWTWAVQFDLCLAHGDVAKLHHELPDELCAHVLAPSLQRFAVADGQFRRSPTGTLTPLDVIALAGPAALVELCEPITTPPEQPPPPVEHDLDAGRPWLADPLPKRPRTPLRHRAAEAGLFLLLSPVALVILVLTVVPTRGRRCRRRLRRVVRLLKGKGRKDRTDWGGGAPFGNPHPWLSGRWIHPGNPDVVRAGLVKYAEAAGYRAVPGSVRFTNPPGHPRLKIRVTGLPDGPSRVEIQVDIHPEQLKWPMRHAWSLRVRQAWRRG